MKVRLLRKPIKINGLLAAVFICLLITSFAYSASVVNSRHDLSYVATIPEMQLGGEPAYLNDYGEVCVYCHTPHSANLGGSALPLWNRKLGSAEYAESYAVNYTVYGSPTMDTSPSNPPNGISLACLSCHDGTIAVDEIINPPNTGVTESPGHYRMRTTECGICHNPGNPNAHDSYGTYLTTDLSDDHPISMDYPSTSDFNQPITDPRIKLYNNKVECASCHNVHDPDVNNDGTNDQFLRVLNVGSVLCYTCHIK